MKKIAHPRLRARVGLDVELDPDRGERRAGRCFVEHARALTGPRMDRELRLASESVECGLHAEQHGAYQKFLWAPDIVGAAKLRRRSHRDRLAWLSGEPVSAQTDRVAVREGHDHHAW